MQPQALVESNLALVNLMEPLSQKFSTDASSRFADYGNVMGVFMHSSRSRTPLAAKKKVRRVPLKNKDAQPVETVSQALSEMKRLQIKRTDNDLPVLTRTPKFADYAVRYLDFISSGQGTKNRARFKRNAPPWHNGLNKSGACGSTKSSVSM